MNFFRSVFSDDPTPPDSPESTPSPEPEPETEPEANAVRPESQPELGYSPWSFNSFIKTLATKSESVIENYRKDLEELGSGLKKESAMIRDVASRAVTDLPASLEAGASVAQVSLESVGQAIDDIGSSVWKSTAGIISGSKILDIADRNRSSSSYIDGVSSRQYSRFEMQLRELERNWETYCVDPDEVEEYERWKKEGFVSLENWRGEIERLVGERNGIVREMYNVLIGGNKVDEFGFWSRYFFRVDKLRKAEEARALLVKRAIARDDEEDLSWDFDDEGNDVDEDVSKGGKKNGSLLKGGSSGEVDVGAKDVESVVENASDGVGEGEGEGKAESVESSRDSDVSMVSRISLVVPEAEEVDVGWDEIEDIGSNDESKDNGKVSASTTTSTSKDDLRKRLTTAEEDEDLSWDIDDDDDDDDESGKP